MSNPFSNLPTLTLYTFCGKRGESRNQIHLQISQEYRYIQITKEEAVLLITELQKFINLPEKTDETKY